MATSKWSEQQLADAGKFIASNIDNPAEIERVRAHIEKATGMDISAGDLINAASRSGVTLAAPTAGVLSGDVAPSTWTQQNLIDAGNFIAQNIDNPAAIEAARANVEQATGQNISSLDLLRAAQSAQKPPELSRAMADVLSGDVYGGMTARQAYDWITKGVIDQPQLSAQTAQNVMRNLGISSRDLAQAALLDPRISAGAQYALTSTPLYQSGQQSGLAALNENLRDFINKSLQAQSPTQAEASLRSILQSGLLTGGKALNEYDVERATGKTLSQLFGPQVLPPTRPLPPITEPYVPRTAPAPEAAPPALSPGASGLDPSTAIVGNISVSEQVKIPQLDAEFRASAPRTPVYDRLGRVTGYEYTPAAKLAPATGTTVFNWTPPGVTSRPRQLLNMQDVPGATFDPVTGEARMPLSASQQFARDRAQLDREFRQMYAQRAATDSSIPAQAPAAAAQAFRESAMSDPAFSAQLRLRELEQQRFEPTKADTSLRAQYGAAPYQAALSNMFLPFITRNLPTLQSLVKTKVPLYSEKYPDIAAEYAKLSAEDKEKFPTIADYEQFHYQTYGQKEGRDSPTLGRGDLTSPYTTRFLKDGGAVSTEDFIAKKSDGGDVSRGDVSRGTPSPNPAEVPSVIDERDEIRSESQRMLNRLKAQGPRSTGFVKGRVPEGVAALQRDIEQRQIDASKPGSAATMPLIDRPIMRIASDIVRGATSTTPVDPTNPSEAYRLVQGLTNAYLPTAPVVRMGQSAKAAVQQPRATAASVKRGVEELGDTAAAQLARLSEPNTLGSQAGMVRISKPESRIFSPTPSAQNPFVGRLDEYISTMPNKVQKDQFLSQLTGKFRDYEIQRAKDALEGLPGNASLTPSDLLNRIKGNYDPARFKTQVIEPDAKAHAEAVANNTQLPFYGSVDNPFPDRPMGVVHLIQEPSPVMASSKEQSNLIEDAYNATYRTYIQDGPEFEEFVQRIEAPFNKIPSLALLREEARPLLQGIRELAKRNTEVSDARDAIRYAAIDQRYLDFKERGLPVEVPNYVLNDKGRFVQQGTRRLEPYDYLSYTDFLAKEGDATILKILDEMDPEEYARVMQKDVDAVKNQIRDINQRIEATKEKVASKDSFFVSSDEAVEGRKDAVDDATSFIRLYDQAKVKEQIEPLREMLDEQRRTFIRSSSIPYMGRHTSLKNEPDPISFSRFSEQEIDLPDLGRIKGIYINELQSDRLRSLREEGPFGGSRIKDFPKLQELETQGQRLKDRWMSLVGDPKASKSSIRDAKEELDTFISKKLAPFQNRVTQGKYSIKESFAGMENSPQVVQQLMAKNAVRAAIERGDRFVAFPGKESAQPQLYEKLPNNLKQVVKDLGPGFDIRPIELQSSKLGPFTTTAIVWGPEAAARLKKQGVPFKHGGPVDKTTAFIKAHA